ncbi:serine/threonine-protein kinase haspin homolog isoform X2 [Cucumis sativus]|uniref:serine/threonine-protein kinase haspin homolog isoform X2 n=1 Tax=Cucumis sativus TaxID=3659 RepID=UPI0005ECB515|nr:serine/threonine-protein kinase haspin homolog isoform X2 [Cucumis sativus]
MTSNLGGKAIDLWSELIASEGSDLQEEASVEEVYRRRKPTQKTVHPPHPKQNLGSNGCNVNRVSLAAVDSKRISWNRALSIRGRVSIAVEACIDRQRQCKQAKRKGKPALPKGKYVQPTNFDKERAYFQEVDAFELLEESPSPKSFSTWTSSQFDSSTIPSLCSRIEKWLISKKSKYSLAPSSTLSKILETPLGSIEPIGGIHLDKFKLKTPENSARDRDAHWCSIQRRFIFSINDIDALKIDSNDNRSNRAEEMRTEDREDIEVAVKKLSLTSTSTSFHKYDLDPLSALLAVCGQSTPSTLKDVFSNYCELETIVKVGEGTYGEAFKVGNTVCKVVPIDGDLKVNGEIQKRSVELLEEVILSRTLNSLRSNERCADNFCTTFIRTIDLRVCQGSYDAVLVKAWEDWDEKHGSENDHPKEFPEKQLYVVFVLQHGGKDLESFVLLNYDEAQSLLVQVTAALAVAEAAYQFEHRDLHWSDYSSIYSYFSRFFSLATDLHHVFIARGNVLLSRNDYEALQFTLESKNMTVKTFGLQISIIDFTLSRINTGEDILFLDLSSDPYLFKGPRGDRQSETYRKMKEVTGDCWEGSFPRTNVLWLLYLVDILLLKKSFERSSKHERELRAFKKRLDKYTSTKEAIYDQFFSELIVWSSSVE